MLGVLGGHMQDGRLMASEHEGTCHGNLLLYQMQVGSHDVLQPPVKVTQSNKQDMLQLLGFPAWAPTLWGMGKPRHRGRCKSHWLAGACTGAFLEAWGWAEGRIHSDTAGAEGVYSPMPDSHLGWLNHLSVLRSFQKPGSPWGKLGGM